MERDNDYVKSMEAWFSDMELNIEQTQNSLNFHNKELELHQKHIAVLEESIEHDSIRLAKARKDYDKYLEDTNSIKVEPSYLLNDEDHVKAVFEAHLNHLEEKQQGYKHE
jgi:chromosome segregation ATPase